MRDEHIIIIIFYIILRGSGVRCYARPGSDTPLITLSRLRGTRSAIVDTNERRFDLLFDHFALRSLRRSVLDTVRVLRVAVR